MSYSAFDWYSRDPVAFGSAMHLAAYLGLVEIAVAFFKKCFSYDDREN